MVSNGAITAGESATKETVGSGRITNGSGAQFSAGGAKLALTAASGGPIVREGTKSHVPGSSQKSASAGVRTSETQIGDQQCAADTEDLASTQAELWQWWSSKGKRKRMSSGAAGCGDSRGTGYPGRRGRRTPGGDGDGALQGSPPAHKRGCASKHRKPCHDTLGEPRKRGRQPKPCEVSPSALQQSSRSNLSKSTHASQREPHNSDSENEEASTDFAERPLKCPKASVARNTSSRRRASKMRRRQGGEGSPLSIASERSPASNEIEDDVSDDGLGSEDDDNELSGENVWDPCKAMPQNADRGTTPTVLPPRSGSFSGSAGGASPAPVELTQRSLVPPARRRLSLNSGGSSFQGSSAARSNGSSATAWATSGGSYHARSPFGDAVSNVSAPPREPTFKLSLEALQGRWCHSKTQFGKFTVRDRTVTFDQGTILEVDVHLNGALAVAGWLASEEKSTAACIVWTRAGEILSWHRDEDAGSARRPVTHRPRPRLVLDFSAAAGDC